MTVRELIDELSKLPQDALVWVEQDAGYADCAVDKVPQEENVVAIYPAKK